MLLVPLGATAQAPSEAARSTEPPAWFSQTFLDFREDLRDAAREQRRLLVYFGQDGCPYCAEMMRTSFSQASIVEKTRRSFSAIEINIWGDREVTWTDGRVRSEKDFARFLKVQFTPTVLLLDEAGGVVARLNGYYPPHRFEAAIDYAAGKLERKLPFDQYMRSAVKETASATLQDEPFFMKPSQPLARKAGGRPLAVLFETPYCSGCDELHHDAFRRPDVLRQLQRFDVARLELGTPGRLVTPDGRRSTAAQWERDLKIGYTPTLVLFDPRGREVFRIEAYLRSFHLASALDYVASGAYAKEPSFQRFIQARADGLRAKGDKVDIWQ
jgi:thioredoxin-related protein